MPESFQREEVLNSAQWIEGRKKEISLTIAQSMRGPRGRIEGGRAPIKYLALPGQDHSSLQLWLHWKLSLERELRTG